jgi:hypothetical protein
MKRCAIIATLLFFYFVQPVEAQLYQKRMAVPTQPAFGTSVSYNSSGNIFAGYLQPYGLIGNYPFVSFFLPDGTSQWSNFFHGNGSSQIFIRNVFRAPDDGFIVQGSGPFIYNIANIPPSILKIDSSGALEWARYYLPMDSIIDDYSCSGFCAASAGDGSLILAGNSYYLPDTTLIVFLSKLNATGNVLNSRFYLLEDSLGSHHDLVGTDMVVDVDGNVLICGNLGNYPQSFFVLKTDSNLAPLWVKVFSDSTAVSVNKIVVDSSGVIYVAGSDDFASFRTFLLSIAPSGNLLSQFRFSLENFGFPSLGLALYENDIVLTGKGGIIKFNCLDSVEIWGTKTNPLILITDLAILPNGEIFYGGNSGNSIYYATLTGNCSMDGDLACNDSSFSYGFIPATFLENNQFTMLSNVTMVTDSIFNLTLSATPGYIDLCQIVGIDEQEPSRLSVFPNPASRDCKITLSGDEIITQIELLSSLGQELSVIKHFTHSSEVLIDLSGVSPGIYFLRVSSMDKVYQKKLVVGH